jgi:predicted nuclease of predicted toxin-antitoxin system
MRVKLDEDLSEVLCSDLCAAGYDAATVVTQKWTGTQDVDLWPRLVSERIYWITADKGFGDLRTYAPGTHAGILLLRPEKESIASFRALILEVLRAHRFETLVGALTVASPGSIRIRRE